MSVRLFHRGARLVFVVRRRAAGEETWWSPHLSAPDWGAILANQLDLLGLPAEAPESPQRLVCRLGEIRWIAARRWSIITLHLHGGSDTKRGLVAGALAKAARYARAARVAHRA